MADEPVYRGPYLGGLARGLVRVDLHRIFDRSTFTVLAAFCFRPNLNVGTLEKPTCILLEILFALAKLAGASARISAPKQGPVPSKPAPVQFLTRPSHDESLSSLQNNIY